MFVVVQPISTSSCDLVFLLLAKKNTLKLLPRTIHIHPFNPWKLWIIEFQNSWRRRRRPKVLLIRKSYKSFKFYSEIKHRQLCLSVFLTFVLNNINSRKLNGYGRKDVALIQSKIYPRKQIKEKPPESWLPAAVLS